MKRRQALVKGFVIPALGGTAIWQTPLVSSVILPAHAQTSCASVASSLFRVTDQQGFEFSLRNNCIESISGTQSSSAELFIELGASQIKGTVAAAHITMNYSQNPIPRNHSFLPDSQSNNVPFIISLDDFSSNTMVRLELNYFESSGILEVRVLLN